MQQAAADAARTLAVLSPDYLTSDFAQAEWYAAFAQDPLGEQGLLLPVRVRDCDLTGLLPQIIYVDLAGSTQTSRPKTGGPTVKGFLLGILVTLVVVGVGYFLQVNYSTFNTCLAVETTLSESVISALQVDVQHRTGSDVAGKIVRGLLQSAAEPIVRNEVQKDIQDRNWFHALSTRF